MKEILRIYHVLYQLKTIQVIKTIYIIFIAAKAVESKNPKFMRTIEEIGNNSQPVGQYNTMLSSSLG